jgi:hypothetical protein
MQTLMHERGLTKDLISKKLMAFNANGVFVFKALGKMLLNKFLMGGLHISTGFHYMAHKTNLAIQTLSHWQMVNRIEGLF